MTFGRQITSGQGLFSIGFLWCITFYSGSCNSEYPNEYWMGNLSVKMQSIPLNFIAIPGSHDSATYNITGDSIVSPDGNRLVYLLYKLFGKFITNVISKWSRTQTLNITEQLKLGIRYFDLRIAPYTPEPWEYYIVHEQYSVSFLLVLEEVKAFLATHKREIVLLDLKHFYGMDDTHHARLITLIMDTVGDLLAPQPRGVGRVPSLSLFLAAGKRIIMFYNKLYLYYPPLWQSKYCPSLWPQSFHATEMIYEINDQLPTFRKSFLQFVVVQGVRTPSFQTIIFHGLQTLYYFSEAASKTFVDWINTKTIVLERLNSINICIADFVDRHDFVNAVLRVNNRTVLW